MKKFAIIGAALTALPGLLSATHSASAATATSSFKISLTITKDCAISTPADININTGTASALIAGAKGTTTFNVACSKGTPYTIGFAGANDVGADTATHQINTAAPVKYINYQLTDTTAGAANTKPLSATSSVISDTGTGSAQAKTIQAQIVNYTSMADPGTYTDTVTLTLTY
jgi:spore coat protein U-like protein